MQCPFFISALARGIELIIGIGTDICEIERIADAMERQGERFRKRICSERELKLAARRTEQVTFYAGRFAAKEACAKALGTGITERVRWTHIEVLADKIGRPVLHLSEGALRRGKRLARGGDFRCRVSIAHDGSFAIAFVVLEAG